MSMSNSRNCISSAFRTHQPRKIMRSPSSFLLFLAALLVFTPAAPASGIRLQRTSDSSADHAPAADVQIQEYTAGD
ncbi:unnamed protein product, partial [Amoebophrya sp. A120]|eukprot:GSA120T00024570001.1